MNYKTWSGISIFLFILCIGMFYILYTVEKDRTIDQLNERQFIHAKQAAKGLENYIDSWVKRLVLLSKNESIVLGRLQIKKIPIQPEINFSRQFR